MEGGTDTLRWWVWLWNTKELYTEQLDNAFQNYKSTFDPSVSPPGVFSAASQMSCIKRDAKQVVGIF